MGLDTLLHTEYSYYYGHYSRDNHVSFGVRLAIPAFQVRSGPMANSANPDLRGMMSYIWVVARVEDIFRMDMDGRVIFKLWCRRNLEKKGEGQRKKKQAKKKKARSVGHLPAASEE